MEKKLFFIGIAHAQNAQLYTLKNIPQNKFPQYTLKKVKRIEKGKQKQKESCLFVRMCECVRVRTQSSTNLVSQDINLRINGISEICERFFFIVVAVKKGRKMVCIRHQINQVYEIKRTGTKWAFLEMWANQRNGDKNESLWKRLKSHETRKKNSACVCQKQIFEQIIYTRFFFREDCVARQRHRCNDGKSHH